MVRNCFDQIHILVEGLLIRLWPDSNMLWVIIFPVLPTPSCRGRDEAIIAATRGGRERREEQGDEVQEVYVGVFR